MGHPNFTGAEAPRLFSAERGAEAPLFHGGTSRILDLAGDKPWAQRWRTGREIGGSRSLVLREVRWCLEESRFLTAASRRFGMTESLRGLQFSGARREENGWKN
jgi:hypothetical protein